MGNRFLTRVLEHMDGHSDRPFCTTVGRKRSELFSWSDLEHDCRRFAQLYVDHGLGEGDQVLIFLEFGRSLYGAFIGAMLCGVVPSFMPTLSIRQNPTIFWSSHRELLNRLQPAAIIGSAQVFGEMTAAGLQFGNMRRIYLEDLPDSGRCEWSIVKDGSLAFLQHSSGTTGLKKGVALTYNALVRQLDSYSAALKLTGRERIVSWLPLYHDMGLVACFLLPLYQALEIHHIEPERWVTRPMVLFEALHGREGTLIWMPNFAFDHMTMTLGETLKAGNFDLAGVKAFINCSEPCKPESFDRFLQTFAALGVRPEQLQCCYAMAETTFAATQTNIGDVPCRVRVDPDRLGIGQTPIDSVGRMEIIESGREVHGIRIDYYDEHREIVPDETVGEIGITGSFLFREYNKDPERTFQQLQGGVYFTNDLGFRHHGSHFVLGRKDDVIIVNGRNLFAHEIEKVLADVAGLRPGRAVAVALQNERTGTCDLIILAERNPRVDRNDEAIRQEVIARIYSVFAVHPKSVAIREPGTLVKTTSGKISRRLNLAQYLGEGQQSGSA